MIGNLKTRWIWVSFCWMVVAFLTFWNISKIESIEKVREKKEIYLMDEQFWNYNAVNIAQILKMSALLRQEVDSSKLGLFEFESNVRNLAIRSGLKSITVTSRSQFEQDGIIPVNVSFLSTLQHAAKWIENIELDLPHAKVRSVKIKVDEMTKQKKFTVSISYRYKQSVADASL